MHMSSHHPFNFKSLDEVEQHIQKLGLNLPLRSDLTVLSQPISIGKFRVPNRFVVLPMEGCDGLADGSPDELTYRRYQRFASGGAGILWFEATAVVPEGRANPRQLWLHEKTVGAFARMVEESRKAATSIFGEKHQPLMIVQLTHSGRYSRPSLHPKPVIAHHSQYLDPIHKLAPDYPLISDEELRQLEDRYVEAALYAQKAGFHGVDVKACHRYSRLQKRNWITLLRY